MADDRERAREHERERRRLAGDADIGGYDSVGNAFMPENPAPGDIDALYGVAGNGLPLDQLFVGVDADAAEEGISVMNAALALGENPRTVVTDLMNVMNVEQARALTIARTEMLGAWRDAQAINYRANSDVLDGWIWSSSLGGACIACVMMDGTVHPLDEDMDSHPNCACIMVPLTKSWDDLLGDIEGLDLSALDETDYLNQGYEDGQDWFLAQSEATQIEVLGPAKFEAWQSGDVDLLDFVGQRDAGAWGNEIYERSLKEIGLDANAYLGRTTLADVTEASVTEETATEAVAATSSFGSADTIREADEAGSIFGDTSNADMFAEMARNGTRLGDELADNEAFQGIVSRVAEIVNEREVSVGVEASEITTTQDAAKYLQWQYHGFLGANRDLSIAMQEAVRAEFGLTTATAYTAEETTAALAQFGDMTDGLRAFFRQMYTDTQAWFADQGIAELTLYRGISWSAGTEPPLNWDGTVQSLDVGLRPISSFSASPSWALEFAKTGDYGLLAADTVPVDQILSTSFTGLGHASEKEVIVLGELSEMYGIPLRDMASLSTNDLYALLAGKQP